MSTDIALYGLIGIFLVVIIGIIGFTIIAVVLAKQNHDIVALARELLDSNRALQIITVAAIVMCIMLLAILGRIEPLSDQVLTVLSSIAAFVLGSLGSSNNLKNKPKTNDEDENHG